MASNHKKDKAVVGGNVKFIVLARNWAHQGFTYLDKTERFYRIIWELLPMSGILYLLSLQDFLIRWGNSFFLYCAYH